MQCVPRCVPEENAPSRETTVASCGSSTSGFFSDRSCTIPKNFQRYPAWTKRNNSLLTRLTGTLPALAASMICVTRGFSMRCSGLYVCRVAANVRNAFTSANWMFMINLHRSTSWWTTSLTSKRPVYGVSGAPEDGADLTARHRMSRESSNCDYMCFCDLCTLSTIRGSPTSHASSTVVSASTSTIGQSTKSSTDPRNHKA